MNILQTDHKQKNIFQKVIQHNILCIIRRLYKMPNSNLKNEFVNKI